MFCLYILDKCSQDQKASLERFFVILGKKREQTLQSISRNPILTKSHFKNLMQILKNLLREQPTNNFQLF